MTTEDGDEIRLFVAALFAGPDPASGVLPLASTTNPEVDETRAFLARLFATPTD